MITILACDTNNIKELLEAAGYTVTTATVGTLTVYKITVNSTTVQVLNPGMTKVEVAKAIATLNYAESAPSKIIVTGNCASICPVRIGTMAISTSAVQHDVDFSAMNLRRGTLPVVHETVFTAGSDLITAAISAIKSKNYIGRKGRYASGDQVIDCCIKAEEIRRCFNSYFIDTETGDIGEICSDFNIPWVPVKGVSNYANSKTPCMYEIYSDTANTASLKVALGMLDSLIPAPVPPAPPATGKASTLELTSVLAPTSEN